MDEEEAQVTTVRSTIRGFGTVVPSDTFIGIRLILLYIPVCLIVFRQLIPRLSTTSKGLAVFMLAAQVFVLALSLAFQDASSFEQWLWHLDQEFNIPAALAATQLTLVASVSVRTAWHCRDGSILSRLYLAVIALAFLVLAHDEFFGVHDGIAGWELFYVGLGAALVAATAIVAKTSPRRAWRWHICFLTGLALSAVGALAVEQFRASPACHNAGLLLQGVCVAYVIEEALEFLGMWLALVALLGHLTEAAHRSSGSTGPLFYLLTLLLIMPIGLASLREAIGFRSEHQSNAVRFGSNLTLLIDKLVEEDQAVTLQIFALPDSLDQYYGYGYSLHLVDMVNGVSVAGINEAALRKHPASDASVGGGHSYEQRLTLRIPPYAPRNRVLWAVLSAWRQQEGDFLHLKIEHGHYRALNETQAIVDEIVLRKRPTAVSSTSIATFKNGFALVGVDMPVRARAGAVISIAFSWISQSESEHEYIQFLHFIHEHSGEQWGHDQHPLGDRLPTRHWYAGMADSERWELTLPADLAPGRYEVSTGLYRLRDLQRLPANAADGTPFADARIPLGTFSLRPKAGTS